MPGRDRRAADRHQPHRLAAGGAGAEQGLPPLRGRDAPVQHRQAGVRQRHPRRARLQAVRARHGPALGPQAARDRGLPAPGDGRALRARQDPEVQGQARSQPRPAALRAAPADGPRRAPRHRPIAPGGSCATQVETATRKVDLRQRRGPGRRRRLRLRRALRRALARADHDVRRLRARLHRHPDAARRARHDPLGRRGVRRAPPGAGPGRAGVRRAGDRDPRRGRHQLPDRHRPGQDASTRSPRRPAAPSTGCRSTPTRCTTSPTRSASGSSPTCAATWRRSPTSSAPS